MIGTLGPPAERHDSRECRCHVEMSFEISVGVGEKTTGEAA
jgi:hypothetical protein